MLYNILSSKVSDNFIVLIASVISFAATYGLLAFPFSFLPRDGGKYVTNSEGKKVAINASSSGKVTGAGLVFISIYFISSLLFLPISKEFILYTVFGIFMMLTGYMDDASKSPWGELVKGLLDLVVAILAAVTFLIFNGSEVYFFGHKYHMPVVVYGVLAVALIWASINVTNCTDGIDGLCGSLSVVELIALAILFNKHLGKYAGLSMILAFTLVAYLAYNWNPSTVLMGDAGSRTIGYTMALLCMLSKHPFAFLLLSLVFIFDGGLGLLKLAVMRITKKPFLQKWMFPVHDELRKKRKIKIPVIVIFFVLLEIIFVIITGVIIHVFGG